MCTQSCSTNQWTSQRPNEKHLRKVPNFSEIRQAENDRLVAHIRNALFHSGATVATQTGRGGSFAQTMKPIVAVVDTADELLLRALGYEGAYASWWGGADKTISKT